MTKSSWCILQHNALARRSPLPRPRIFHRRLVEDNILKMIVALESTKTREQAIVGGGFAREQALNVVGGKLQEYAREPQLKRRAVRGG
jgi:hypothetical protein